MKLCNSCGENKPVHNFNKNKNSKDGLRSTCKPCVNTKDKAYRQLPHVRVAREKARKAYVLRNTIKVKAKQIVAQEVKMGRLIKGCCEVCEATNNIEGHHDDYAKPKEVRWLCVTHHNEWHKLNGKAKNG